MTFGATREIADPTAYSPDEEKLTSVEICQNMRMSSPPTITHQKTNIRDICGFTLSRPVTLDI